MNLISDRLQVVLTSGGGSPCPPAAKPAPAPHKPVVVANWQQSMGSSAARLCFIPSSLSSDSPVMPLDRQMPAIPSSPVQHLTLSARDTAQLPHHSSHLDSPMSGPVPEQSASFSGAELDDSNLMLDDDSASDFQPRSDPTRRRILQSQSRVRLYSCMP